MRRECSDKELHEENLTQKHFLESLFSRQEPFRLLKNTTLYVTT